MKTYNLPKKYRGIGFNLNELKPKTLKVNLGCGYDIKPGYLNVDAIKTTPETIVQDLNEDWTFLQDNSVDEILIHSVIEHLKDMFHFFGEVERVLKVGGKIDFDYPNFRAPSAYTISHEQFFSWRTWDTFPEFLDLDEKKAVFALKVIKNYMIVEDRIFPFTLLNPIVNLFPKYYEKLSAWVLGGHVIMIRLKKNPDPETRITKNTLSYRSNKERLEKDGLEV